MNSETTPSSRIVPLEPSHQQNHYRRIVIIIAIVLAVIVLGLVIYQLITSSSTDKAAKEEALLQEYQLEQLAAAQEFFKAHPVSGEPMTDEGFKAQQEFFKTYATDTEITEERFAELQKGMANVQKYQQEKYEDWKVSRTQK